MILPMPFEEEVRGEEAEALRALIRTLVEGRTGLISLIKFLAGGERDGAGMGEDRGS